jgi:eukaryotic-like serine/threonine-protein kinase
MTTVAAGSSRRSLLPVWIGIALAVALAAVALGVALTRTAGSSQRGPASTVKAVPLVVGMTLNAAKAELQAAGFSVDIAGTEYSSSVPRGIIASENPVAGSHAPKGAVVSVRLSKGPYLTH